MGQSKEQKQARAERIALVAELHARGLTFEQIAARKIPGVSSKQQAHLLWKEARDAAPVKSVEEWRWLQNTQIDAVERRLNTVIMDREADPKDVIRGAMALISAYKRRADLNGLDLRVSEDGPASGVQTVFVDMGLLTKTIRAEGEEDDDSSG